MGFVSELIGFVSQNPLEVLSLLGTLLASIQFIPAKIKRPVLEAGGILYSKIKEYYKLKREVKRLEEKLEELNKQKEEKVTNVSN